MRGSRNTTLDVKPGNARGDLTGSHVIWRANRYVPEAPTPLAYQSLLNMVKDGGILTVRNLESGENLRVGRMRGAIDKCYPSSVARDGKIYRISETGKLSILKPGADWETLAVNDLGEPSYATSAIEDGKIYLRTSSSCTASQISRTAAAPETYCQKTTKLRTSGGVTSKTNAPMRFAFRPYLPSMENVTSTSPTGMEMCCLPLLIKLIGLPYTRSLPRKRHSASPV